MNSVCNMCGEFEVATFQFHNHFCSDMCADEAYQFLMDNDNDNEEKNDD